MACRIAFYDEDESDPEGHVLHCNSYPRELKLSAVHWSENTFVRGKKPNDSLRPMKPYEAAKRLDITQTMLKSWSKNKGKIALQKKHSRRARSLKLRARQPEMEHALFRKFQESSSQIPILTYA
jgi:hypothetical protein